MEQLFALVSEPFGYEKTLNNNNNNKMWTLSLKIHEVAIMLHFLRRLIKHL